MTTKNTKAKGQAKQKSARGRKVAAARAANAEMRARLSGMSTVQLASFISGLDSTTLNRVSKTIAKAQEKGREAAIAAKRAEVEAAKRELAELEGDNAEG
jgi:predicted nucleotide-binding protein (sugar kinase/HSP70/actin superfamily)